MHHATRGILVLALGVGQLSIAGGAAAQTPGKPTPATQPPATPTPSAQAPAAEAPGTPPPLARSDNRLKMNGFSVDYPKKDWNMIGGTGSSLVVFVHKSREATVAIERGTLKQPLSPADITETTLKLEIEDWQERRAQSSDFAPQIITAAGTRFVLIDLYTTGPQWPEHVRLYAQPRGLDLYRIICTTKRGGLDKYKEVFHRIALSLTPAPATP
jgi:hypothetical protein